MDVDDFIALDLEEQILRLRGEVGLLQSLWAREHAFGRLWARALELLISPSGRGHLDTSARAVADMTYVHLVKRPSDLLFLISGHTEAHAVWFLRDYVRHPLSRHDVISGVATTPTALTHLPPDGGWLEVVVLVHGMRRLNSSPGRRFTIEELTPLGIDTARSTSRAVLSSALDNAQLATADRERLLTLFPDDRYFRSKIQRKGEKA